MLVLHSVVMTKLTSEWVKRAACRPPNHRLPWIAEQNPGPEHRAEMGAICARCPVRGECAERVVERLSMGRIIGGFYAGVWLPWPPSATPTATNVGRRQALDALRKQAIDSETTRVLSDEERYVRGRV